MKQLATLIDNGWDVGFYTTQVADDNGFVTRIVWRAKFKDGEYMAKKGFTEADRVLNDFIIFAENISDKIVIE